MTWGAVNEWTTQAGYGRLAAKAKHPVLSELLRRIMRQEGRHIDFYALGARRRLADSATARSASPASPCAATGRRSAPGSCPTPRCEFLVNHLFGDDDGRAGGAAHRPRRRAAPGLEGLHLVESAVDDLTVTPPRATSHAPGAAPRDNPHRNTNRKRSNVMLAEIFGLDGVVVLVVVVAVLFGGTQIPKLARSLGSARSEFKKGLAEVQDPSVDTDARRRAPRSAARHRPDPSGGIVMILLSPPKLLMILVIALIVLGPDKLPSTARRVGRAVERLQTVAGTSRERGARHLPRPPVDDGDRPGGALPHLHARPAGRRARRDVGRRPRPARVTAGAGATPRSDRRRHGPVRPTARRGTPDSPGRSDGRRRGTRRRRR